MGVYELLYKEERRASENTVIVFSLPPTFLPAPQETVRNLGFLLRGIWGSFSCFFPRIHFFLFDHGYYVDSSTPYFYVFLDLNLFFQLKYGWRTIA